MYNCEISASYMLGVNQYTAQTYCNYRWRYTDSVADIGLRHSVHKNPTEFFYYS